jgi:hypothetical protein
MISRMFKELKEKLHKKLNESQRQESREGR